MSTRVFNMPARHLIADSETKEYGAFASTAVGQIYSPSDGRNIVRLSPDVRITPRLTKSELHHDSAPGVALAVGSTSNPDVPLKLWLLWPSTELHRLASCYSNTEAALDCMDHGCFSIQMPGDTLAVPGNSPRAVVVLESCYVYNHVFQMQSQSYDPSAVQAELSVATSAEEAYKSCTQQLIHGLASPKFRLAHIDRFIQSWAPSAATLRAPPYAPLF